MSSTLQQSLRRALALYQDGMPEDAESLCDAVLVLDPDNVDALQIAGLARLERGMNAAARDALEKAVGLAPDDAAGHVNLATALLRLGKPAAASRELQRALCLQPGLPEAHYNLGNTLLALGCAAEAEEAFERAVTLRPDYADALNNLGQMLRDRGDMAGAAQRFHRALNAAPSYGPAWSNLCGLLIDLDRAADAVAAGRRAALLLPGDARAHYNLGNAFAAALIPAEAAGCYRRALQIDPCFADAFVNLGVAQMNLGDTDGAVTAFEHALALDAGLPEANWNKALALLLAGRWEDAWELYEWRWQAVRGMRLPELGKPMWDGAHGTGGTVLIRCEQAYGDAIQFVRYLPMVRARGWRVVLECPPALERLLRDSGLADSVIAFGAPRPAFDCWLPIMSLARIFETSLETVPADLPYLVAGQGPGRREGARGFTVGIVWQGSLTNGRGRYRSCALADLLPLQEVPGVSLVSLQTQLSDKDAAVLRRFGISDLASNLRDFADSAMLASQVDLVITVDTAMAHLAGALGCRVWTLLSAFPDWRWLLDRGDSPWYPGMRLFRQRRIADWAPVVDEVASALSRHMRGGAPTMQSVQPEQMQPATARQRETMTETMIPVMHPRLPNAEALRPYLEEIDRNNWYSNFGPLERRLERRLAERYDLPAKNVVAVGNCTAGLMLALGARARERGGYCILPSYTFVASAHAVLAAGLIPLFVDVDPDTWAVTPALVSEAIRTADRTVAAVMVVSPFGAPVDVAAWDAFADESGVPVVIDAAAGFDSAVAGRSPVVVSLHATKVLGAGEGGFVMSRDTTLVGAIASRSNFGFHNGRHAEAIGFNGKFNEYCAAVALASLDVWPRMRPPLVALTQRYREVLQGIAGVRTAPGFGDGWVGGTCNIRFDRPVADGAMSSLTDAGIDSRQWWTKGCHRETAFAEFPHRALPVTEDLAMRVLGLPFHDSLTEADVERIAAAVGAIARG